MLVKILAGQILLEQVGIVAHFIAAYMDGAGRAEYIREFVQHIIDHLLGFGFSHIHGGTGQAVGIVVLLDHVGIEELKLRVLVPVADGVEDGDEGDVIVLGIFN
jgi:hypothetical protein